MYSTKWWHRQMDSRSGVVIHLNCAKISILIAKLCSAQPRRPTQWQDQANSSRHGRHIYCSQNRTGGWAKTGFPSPEFQPTRQRQHVLCCDVGTYKLKLIGRPLALVSRHEATRFLLMYDQPLQSFCGLVSVANRCLPSAVGAVDLWKKYLIKINLKLFYCFMI